MHKQRASEIIAFVLGLSVLEIDKSYAMSQKSVGGLEMEIMSDLMELGLVQKAGTGCVRITYLLWNFVYEQPVREGDDG